MTDKPSDTGPGQQADSVLEQYRAKGLAGRVGFGFRPAVLVIDFILGFTDAASPLGSSAAI
jgi:hypothetical protein